MSNHVDTYVAELTRLLGRSAAADGVIREARSHLEDKVAAVQREGMTQADAERQAVLAFGDAREFAIAALVSGSVDATLPGVLRWVMLAGTVIMGLIAGGLFIAIVGTALFGGEGESAVALAVIGGGAAAVLLHAVAFGRVLLRPRRQGWMRSAVLLGGIGLLAVSGAAVLGGEVDDSPGGMLLGFLLAAQGGAAVLAVAFPQLKPARVVQA